MIINHEEIQWHKNAMVQICEKLEEAMRIGRLTLEHSRSVFDEWIMDKPLDATIGLQAEVWLAEREEL